MADTRIMLTCKHCGAGMRIGKGYDGSYYTVNKNMFQDLNAFYEVHEQGECSDDADYSQDAKNHFVILEEGETLADVVPKSEVAREIMREVRQALLNMVLANSMGKTYGIEKRFAEIEKKYTGVEDGDGRN